MMDYTIKANHIVVAANSPVNDKITMHTTVLGVYGIQYDNFPLHQWFDKGIQIKGGQAPVHNYIDHLIELVATGKVVLDDIITHKVPLSEATKMYDIFNNKEDNCVKVVLKP
ncbi:hypothetical protein [Flavobacterium sp. NRK1]|uniref:hypothetical protein n=1 Tax=Flavobacterium sp. NRK1 TaxID=2954929 RepID=UPI002092ECD1|nr:hypothetical protein [Flavobacterium sp. NRK1]MCO6149656.1 hypothetical protein [Flavobacterium sp. NRK1]